MSDDLNPLDRDALVRTVIGEAGNQGPEGMAAVAQSVMNRVVSGRYGSSPAAVVLAPGQYEPWATRRQELLGYSPNSPAYQQAGGIVDAVAAGDIPDSTNGATHFYSPTAQAALGRQPPKWATKPTAKVGDHLFFAPEGKASASTAIDAINDAIGADNAPTSALGFSGDDTSSPGGMFRAAGFAVPGSKQPAPDNAAPAASPASSGSMFEAAGFKLPGSPQAEPDTSWKDREAQENLAAQGVPTTPAAPTGPGRGIVQALKDYPGVLLDRLKHVPQGVLDTLAAPGDVLASDKPSTDEDLIPRAVGLAGIESLLPTSAVGSAAAAAVAAKAGPSAQAVNALVKAIGPENVPAAVERLKANPRLAVADVSDPVRTMTQGLVDPAQPAAQNAISTAVKNRLQSAPEATNSAYTAAMGPAPNVVTMVEGLKERARAAGREAIQPAIENAKPVDVSPVISAIDEKLQPGINAMLDPKSQLPLSDLQQELARFKQQLTTGNGEQLFDAQRLHRVQSDIGDQAYQLSKSPNPKDRLLGGQLRDMNEKLIDQIDEATNGAYRPARQKFADAKDISAAFESGFDTLKNRQGLTGALEDTPDALRAWMKEATPEEVVARRLGTRADIDQKINGVKNAALAGETITRIEYNKDKLRALFGDNEANRLIRSMEDARDQSVTNNKLIANSKTAETLAGQKALAVPKVGGGNPLTYVAPIAAEMLGEGYGIPGAGFAVAALKGAHMGVQKLGQMNALARNTEFAKAAMATGQARQALMDRLMSHPKVAPYRGPNLGPLQP
jgi:Cell Wall Hydrolase